MDKYDDELERDLWQLGANLRSYVANSSELAARREQAVSDAVRRFQMQEQQIGSSWIHFRRRAVNLLGAGAVAVIGLLLFYRGAVESPIVPPLIESQEESPEDEVTSALSSFSEDFSGEYSEFAASAESAQIALSFDDLALEFNDTTLEDVTDEYQES